MMRISRTKVTLLIVTAICAGVVWAEVKKTEKPNRSTSLTTGKAATTQKVEVKPGPRGPVGPDVPLTKAEEKAFARRITVEGFTAKAIQAACDRAKKEKVPVVYLPAGLYKFAEGDTVHPHKDQTILGAGSKTHIKNEAGFMFLIQSDNVRLTRLKMEGDDTTCAKGNRSCGPRVNYGKNVRIDHCEIFGFEWGPSFWRGAVGQVDHCIIHNNAMTGMGYGVLVYGGDKSQILICDNVCWSCRHVVAANGAKSHYTFRHNHVKHDKGLSPGDNHSCIDVHSGMKGGSFVVEYNIIENVKQAQGTWTAAGHVRGNVFRNIRHTAVYHTSKEGLIAENNKFENVKTNYRVGLAENVTIDGKVVKGPQKPLTFPRLKEFKEVGQKVPTTAPAGTGKK